MNTNELRHHGILGQKWGIRRFQNKDGSLTAAGRKRYDVDLDSAKERVKAAKKDARIVSKDYNKESRRNPFKSPSKETIDAMQKARGRVDWEKSKLSDEKAKAGLNKENGKKSKHRLKLEQMYRDKGMSAEEGEIAAYKRAKTEKTLAVVGGATIAAAAAYVAYKHWDRTVDKVIKPGTTLQNISNNSNKGVEDAFYFSTSGMDKAKYKGLYGDALRSNGAVYETQIGVRKGLKVASEKHAAETLSDMVKNNQVSTRELKERFRSWQNSDLSPEQEKMFGKAMKSLERENIDKNVYNAFNTTLVYQNNMPEYNNLTKKFYNTLTSKGYDAIMDMNDKKFSGYGASKPMIAFNAAGKAVVDNVRELKVDEISKNKAIGIADIFVKQCRKQIIPGAAATVGVAAVADKLISKSKRDGIVRDYKRNHPNTELSDSEIINNYYK